MKKEIFWGIGRTWFGVYMMLALTGAMVFTGHIEVSEFLKQATLFLAIGGGILSRNIGDGTSHGKANQRIMKGLVEWMTENRASIANLDPDIPLLPQLDLLTNDQLKQAFRSLDPMVS